MSLPVRAGLTYLSVREGGRVEVGVVDDAEDDAPGGDVLLGPGELSVVDLAELGRLRVK